MIVISRQKVVGWVLIAVCAPYILWFVKVRVLTDGPPLAKGDWIKFAGAIVTLIIGTANVRMAAMREQGRKVAKRE